MREMCTEMFEHKYDCPLFCVYVEASPDQPEECQWQHTFDTGCEK